MGLSSLPILNKLGYTNYWQNTFHTYKFEPLILNKFLLLETLSYLLSTERFFFKYYSKLRTIKFYTSKTLDLGEVEFSRNKTKSYSGEVWFLFYSGFTIISPAVFNSSVLDKRKIKIKINAEQSLLFRTTALNNDDI